MSFGGGSLARNKKKKFVFLKNMFCPLFLALKRFVRRFSYHVMSHARVPPIVRAPCSIRVIERCHAHTLDTTRTLLAQKPLGEGGKNNSNNNKNDYLPCLLIG